MAPFPHGIRFVWQGTAASAMLVLVMVMVLVLVPMLLVDGVAAKRSSSPVTFGSVIKLTHHDSGFNLHSHRVHYASGSGQKSVTGHPKDDENESYWVLLDGKNGVADVSKYARGTPVPCGTAVRLQHMDSGSFLHSHDHKAPMSSQHREVSAFDGSDELDNWVLECTNTNNNNIWMQNSPVRFRHQSTKCYLGALTSRVFGDPISGQIEVSCHQNQAPATTTWVADLGVYYSPPRTDNVDSNTHHNEL